MIQDLLSEQAGVYDFSCDSVFEVSRFLVSEEKGPRLEVLDPRENKDYRALRLQITEVSDKLPYIPLVFPRK